MAQISGASVAFVRGLNEGNPIKYLGSEKDLYDIQNDAVGAGFVDYAGELTGLGKNVAKACKNLPRGNYIQYNDRYKEAALSVFA